jgi:hypothetical protein
MAAVAGIMGVAQELSRSYLTDGMLDVNEINAAFGKAAGKPVAESTPPEDPKG